MSRAASLTLAVAVTVAALALVALWPRHHFRTPSKLDHSQEQDIAKTLAGSAGADQRAVVRQIEQVSTDDIPHEPPELSLYFGTKDLRGTVLDKETRIPVRHARIHAFPMATNVVGEPTHTSATDADGRFHLEQVGEWFRIEILAEGYRPYRHSLSPSDFAASEITCELLPVAYGTVVCILTGAGVDRSTDHDVRLIPRSLDPWVIEEFGVEEGGKVFLAATQAAAPTTYEARVPAHVPLLLAVVLGQQHLAAISLPPLERDERRQVQLELPAGFIVPLRFLSAHEGEVLSFTQPDYHMQLTWEWSALEQATAPELSKTAHAHMVQDGILVPGPGWLALSCSFRGFAPTSMRTRVDPGVVLDVPLVPFRLITVHLVDSDLAPLAFDCARYHMTGGNTTFHSGEMPGFLPKVEVIAVPQDEAQASPSRMKQHDANRGLPGLPHQPDRIDCSQVQLYAPRVPARVDVYIDDEIHAQRDIGQFEDFVTIRVDLEELSTGSLSLWAFDRVRRTPITSYRVEMIRLRKDGSPGTRVTYQVHRDLDGHFDLRRVLECRYLVMLLTGSHKSPGWWQTVDVLGDVELGAIDFGEPGRLRLTIVGHDGLCVEDATVSLYSVELSDTAILDATSSAPRREQRTALNGVVDVTVRSGPVQILVARPFRGRWRQELLDVAAGSVHDRRIMLDPRIHVLVSPELLQEVRDSGAARVVLLDPDTEFELASWFPDESSPDLWVPDSRSLLVRWFAGQGALLGEARVAVENGALVVNTSLDHENP